MSAHTRRHHHLSEDGGLDSRAERKARTREALMQAALRLLEDRGFGSLSLREVTRQAGLSPTGFYRHFQDMDELGFALVDESFRRLRRMLRDARAGQPAYSGVIRSSVDILARQVHDNIPHFRFVARERSGGAPALRRAIRAEVKLFSSELATDLARFPALRGLTSEDLEIVAALMVSTMVAMVEAILDLVPEDLTGELEIKQVGVKQLRLAALAASHWRSADGEPPPVLT